MALNVEVNILPIPPVTPLVTLPIPPVTPLVTLPIPPVTPLVTLPIPKPNASFCSFLFCLLVISI